MPPAGRTEMVNALLDDIRPRTKGPGARFSLAFRIGLAFGLFHAGRRDDARRVLEAALDTAKKAGVKRRVEAVLATFGSDAQRPAEDRAAAKSLASAVRPADAGRMARQVAMPPGETR